MGIRFEHVTYRYAEDQPELPPALRILNLELGQGRFITVRTAGVGQVDAVAAVQRHLSAERRRGLYPGLSDSVRGEAKASK